MGNSKDLFSASDAQILKDFADTIDSGLTRIAHEITPPPSNDCLETAIYTAGDDIRKGLVIIASAIERLARAFEKE